MRKFGLGFIDQAIAAVQIIEQQVPNRYWMNVSAVDQVKYNTMMTLLKRVRCHHTPTAAECSTQLE